MNKSFSVQDGGKISHWNWYCIQMRTHCCPNNFHLNWSNRIDCWWDKRKVKTTVRTVTSLADPTRTLLISSCGWLFSSYFRNINYIFTISMKFWTKGNKILIFFSNSYRRINHTLNWSNGNVGVDNNDRFISSIEIQPSMKWSKEESNKNPLKTFFCWNLKWMINEEWEKRTSNETSMNSHSSHYHCYYWYPFSQYQIITFNHVYNCYGITASNDEAEKNSVRNDK